MTESEIVGALENIEAFADSKPCYLRQTESQINAFFARNAMRHIESVVAGLDPKQQQLFKSLVS